jgi:AcrR family transcriptional regulator
MARASRALRTEHTTRTRGRGFGASPETLRALPEGGHTAWVARTGHVSRLRGSRVKIRGVARGTQEARPKPGRPRSAEADGAILGAALKLLGERGYTNMSIDQVAAEAGVSRATVYRRYRDKADLVTEAVASRYGSEEAPDTGSTYSDLLELVRQGRAKLEGEAGMPLAGVLLVEGPHDPDLIASSRERVILPRRKRYRLVLERGLRRGEIRTGTDVEAVIDALIGAYYARHLSGLPADEGWAERVLREFWLPLGAETND